MQNNEFRSLDDKLI